MNARTGRNQNGGSWSEGGAGSNLRRAASAGASRPNTSKGTERGTVISGGSTTGSGAVGSGDWFCGWCNRGEHISAIVHCLQTAVGKFALNRHRDQQFPPHEPKATDLCRILIAEKPYGYGPGLANPPTATAGLPKRKSGVSGLIPDYCGAEY